MGDFKYLASLACTGLKAGLMLLVLMAGLLLGVNQLENLSCLTAFLANFKDRLYLLSDNVTRSIFFRAFLYERYCSSRIMAKAHFWTLSI